MNTRDNSIDALRGLAVILMVASHVTWFFSDRTNRFWEYARGLGDTVCFITFIFLFGVGLYFSVFSKESNGELVSKTLKRLLKLVIVYYVVAFVSVAKELFNDFDLRSILEILAFIKVPGFTEFMLAFIFYTAFALLIKLIFLKDPLTFDKKYSLLFIIILAISTYLVGVGVYISSKDLELGRATSSYLSIISYSDGALRFPLLEYAGVLFLGIYMGSVFSKKESLNTSNKIVFSFTAFFILLFGILFLSQFSFKSEYLNIYDRWPPSIFFIALGMIFVYVGLAVLRKLQSTKLKSLLAHYGVMSLGIMMWHLVVLRVLEWGDVSRSNNFILLLLWFIIALGFNDIVLMIKNKFKLNENRPKQ